ncbi:mitogen-activated protein kinase kinase [Ranunculus cassubicifolius]
MEAAVTAAVTSAAANVATVAATNSITRVTNFKENHESLRVKMSELKALHDQVKRRIKVAEDNALTRTAVVNQWLDRVEEINQKAILIIEAGSRQIEQRCCIVGCCPHSWWACYRLGKKVSEMLMTVEELCSKGSFDIVADNYSPSLVQVLPESQTVGLDELFDKVWNLLGKDEVKILGIYGMGGVGKTTLLKKINNAFCNEADKFDVVIWVVVSKELSIRNVQKEIGRRLGFEWIEEEEQTARTQRIFNAMRRKNCVVLLDDIWEHIELGDIGIPSPHDTLNKSKLVFTTRSEDVCGAMLCNERVKVSVLDWDQSWILFQKNVGQEAFRSHPEIPKLAEKVAKECCRLPLALIAIGRAMSSKKTPSEWKHAIKTLGKYAADFSGMEQNVLAILKYSYDNLENDSAKSCFIYFSLYPEDANVLKRDIIYHWIGEGFLDDCEDMDDAIEKGHDIIGSLKAACLLEKGFDEENTVKMHDVVRDLALWVARECGEKRSKFLVQAGVGLTQAPNVGSWKEAERISLMDNKIKELSRIPECSFLLTLLLQWNFDLIGIAPNFFQYMPCLRVLNLRGVGIEKVPESVCGLIGLRFLDLSNTKIKELPEEMRNLVELRYLRLQGTHLLKNIPGGMISHFSRLQLLDFNISGVLVEGSPSIEDLESLEHLRELGITITESQMLSSVLLSQKLSSCITDTCITKCKGLTKLALAPSSSILKNVKKLRTFQIKGCYEMEELEINSATENNNMRLLASLKGLIIDDMPKLNISWICTPIHFGNLSDVRIWKCDLLKDLAWLALVPFLEYLDLENCSQVEDIILHSEFSKTMVDNQTIFSRLMFLTLKNLPKLKSICQLVLPFPCLEHITVIQCPLLKKLPFASSSTKKPLLQIEGQTEWWNALQWEDQIVNSSFQPFFSEGNNNL